MADNQYSNIREPNNLGHTISQHISKKRRTPRQKDFLANVAAFLPVDESSDLHDPPRMWMLIMIMMTMLMMIMRVIVMVISKSLLLWSTVKSIKNCMFCWSNHSPPEFACLLRLHYCCSVATADGRCGRWPLHRSSIPYNSLGDHKTMAHPWHLSQFIQMQICLGVLTWCDVSSCQLELRGEPHPCTATMRCITGNCP